MTHFGVNILFVVNATGYNPWLFNFNSSGVFQQTYLIEFESFPKRLLSISLLIKTRKNNLIPITTDCFFSIFTSVFFG
ncbi:MAG TPA: hypothetical protein DCQ26_08175 [Marinilabiliales bacterium]|nr:MAG: hypothetical protein A2W95_17050 [Bacteroidetes bacterium GWA2_40_14]OFX61036.1 MAG: hypothetical protein A2W84_01880 [Bacteroidetes bacterium GWC2_40_13]OFX75708.1 MAG: hypothetical protein A2W96_09060 [Bacteroidetes bacterium GWD2_40_43]OFX95019.1 MAG: hypothetical protein A2W97_16780 [Bacteroidetes bacterium GWE2_40_63]OFY23530.1 MAG: hypothetical protein A2W88_08595 [Bacteroidetes bacterium GWF2_40_13]OFZ29344.1 MAG: hypothetical protein A2437_09000 [Bacteroidetes bacterium RIFOXYC